MIENAEKDTDQRRPLAFHWHRPSSRSRHTWIQLHLLSHPPTDQPDVLLEHRVEEVHVVALRLDRVREEAESLVPQEAVDWNLTRNQFPSDVVSIVSLIFIFY